MSVEERRESIIAATIPLLLERGDAVTTSQIAAAAGIAEGTVFRAFRDKHDLLTSCLRVAARSDAEVERIAGIRTSLPLAERMTTVSEVVGGYLDRIWRLAHALRSAGVHPQPEDAHADRTARREHAEPRNEMERNMQRVAAAIADLLAPEAARLRVAPPQAARLLLGLIFANRMQGESHAAERPSAEQLVDVFLHGAIDTTSTRGGNG
ncbi:TetR family transcriptional regulator [Gandjariella thermophila]|uniref:TetR family transcriptional regulator n=2 Tax=Gandjariella thermophila TaxID=1931992 RepID=A0A4D4JEJ8_9PSEU|nr:TetR family transcriptional regulator [Gandjariella thermophila]